MSGNKRAHLWGNEFHISRVMPPAPGAGVAPQKGQMGSPSNVHLVLDFLGHYFRSRDVVTIFVCRSLRWFLLGTTRMLLVTSEVDVCRKLLQHVRELLCIHAAEDAPVRTGDGDHHPVIGLRYL